jgi:SAM-dependent methyltransferase
MNKPKDSFENVANVYASIVDQKPIHIYYERPNLWSLLPKNLSNLEILDLGCGSGWYAEQLYNARAKVTAIDASTTMVKLAKQRLQDKVKFFVADLEEPLNFIKNNTFDIILAPLIIHYINDWNPLFLELSRILIKNGLFIFSTHQPHKDITLFHINNYFEKVLIKDYWNEIGEVRFYHHTLNELGEALYKGGFLIERLLEPQPLPQFEKVDFELYKKLCSEPWFLFVKAIKR